MEIISRARWDARHGNGVGVAVVPAPRVALHHTVTPSAGINATLEEDIRTVRQNEEIGASRFGTRYGLSYTWVVTKAGRVFEGHHPAKNGAHTGGLNSVVRAISLIGNYETVDSLTTPQVNAIAWLLRYAHASGWIATPQIWGGHGQFENQATACPGVRARGMISHINLLARTGAAIPIGEDDELDPTQNKWLGEVRYNSVAIIAPNVKTTNSAVANIQTRVANLERQVGSALEVLKEINRKLDS